MLRYLAVVLILVAFLPREVTAQELIIPMDEAQAEHLRAYGAVYWALDRGVEVEWLLNHRGGAFLARGAGELQAELRIRGVSFEAISSSAAGRLTADLESESQNTAVVRLERAPRIAVYAPDQTLPWNDAVMLALRYAEIPYEQVYDDDVLAGRLSEFDWLHLHHEDFTGQYGKFYASYRNAPWYQEEQRRAEAAARAHGFAKVSELKLTVAETIRDYVHNGGYLFAMCSGTETLDVALAAHLTDIVPREFDGDPIAPDALNMLDYERTLAFRDFTPSFVAMEYSHSDIDMAPPPQARNPAIDYFTLIDFSAKWDPVPTMLTQNHVASVRGFMGQTTAFRPELIKPTTVVLASAPSGAVKYIYGPAGQGFFAFYAGHDPEDYQHFVGDPPTDLALHPQSPGYRLILNNVLFPAAQQRPQKT
ncbi:hypothetical protein BH23BAC4_BH23BAC4_15260 [soil metagenome]